MSDDVLAAALRLQRDAAALGFDWQHVEAAWDKLAEEIGELQQAVHESHAGAEDELGDLLFMAINIARHLQIDPVAALAGANVKFARRFAQVCAAPEQLAPLGDPRRLRQMEARWQDAKRAERKPGS
jgi:uncharacterized protein YabN with tetrapyrrole methylase and pyrophosphatase domain